MESWISGLVSATTGTGETGIRLESVFIGTPPPMACRVNLRARDWNSEHAGDWDHIYNRASAHLAARKG